MKFSTYVDLSDEERFTVEVRGPRKEDTRVEVLFGYGSEEGKSWTAHETPVLLSPKQVLLLREALEKVEIPAVTA